MTSSTYRELTAEEQIDLIEQVSDYIRQDIPQLLACGRSFKSDDVARFNRGLGLLEYFQPCRSFVSDARTIQTGYDQYTNRMIYLLDFIKRELASEMQVRTANGEEVIVLPIQQSLRRGRPTAAESEQREREKKDSARAEALAKLTGARIVNADPAPIANRESDTSRRKKEEPNLFSAAVDAATTGETKTEENTPEELKSLREWLWCLPEQQALAIKNLRQTRADIAAESELAKRMMENGESESAIAEHTRKAKALMSDVRDLYASVDKTLAIYYIILTDYNKDYENLATRYEKHGGYDVLVNDLAPYYSRFSGEEVEKLKAKAMKLNEAWVAKTTRDPEKEAKLHRIDAYFRRKDVRASNSRLNKMREYFAEAEKLGVAEDVLEGYKVFIAACEAEL